MNDHVTGNNRSDATIRLTIHAKRTGLVVDVLRSPYVSEDTSVPTTLFVQSLSKLNALPVVGGVAYLVFAATVRIEGAPVVVSADIHPIPIQPGRTRQEDRSARCCRRCRRETAAQKAQNHKHDTSKALTDSLLQGTQPFQGCWILHSKDFANSTLLDAAETCSKNYTASCKYIQH